MKNKTIMRVILIVVFLLIIDKFVSAEYITYTKDFATDVFCDDTDDIRISCEDIGSGRNHGCDNLDPNGCHPWEGNANYGGQSCRITCANIICATPDTIETQACPTTSCGNQTRTCLSNYNWSAWSDCSQEADDCSAGCTSKGFYWDKNASSCCGDDAADDPDMGETACESCKIGNLADDPSKRKWSSNVASGRQCCGDDTTDCALLDQNKYLCVNIGSTATNTSSTNWESTGGGTTTLTPGEWRWANAENADLKGTIIKVGCLGYEILSNGSQWIICTNSSGYTSTTQLTDYPKQNFTWTVTRAMFEYNTMIYTNGSTLSDSCGAHTIANNHYLCTWSDFSSGPDYLCNALGYAKGSTGSYGCEPRTILDEYGSISSEQEVEWRENCEWGSEICSSDLLDLGDLLDLCISTCGQGWCSDDQYVEWVECKADNPETTFSGTGSVNSRDNPSTNPKNIGAFTTENIVTTYTLSDNNDQVTTYFSDTGTATTTNPNAKIYATTSITETTTVQSTMIKDFPKKVVHDYLCFDNSGVYQIAECCGDSSTSCKSTIGGVSYGGVRKTTGGSVSLAETKYYCSDDAAGFNWVADLDATNQNTCDKSGFEWTTTKCCGDDGTSDIYSDPAANGNACYNGTILSSCSSSVSDNKIVNEDGVLNTCDSSLYCKSKCSNNIFCSYTGKWLTGIGRNESKKWPDEKAVPTGGIREECCAQDQCWDGLSCVSNQVSISANSGSGAPHDGYRCVNGNWAAANLKSNPDETSTGFCPSDEQCLVNPSGSYADNNKPDANPQCINITQYKNDNYCEEGNWTTRTKLLALQMLSIPTGDYALFCDNYENVLLYVDYPLGTDSAKNYITSNANKFCALKYGNKVIFGTSLNQPINALDKSFLDVIGITSCSSATAYNDNNFHPCDATTNKAWYNNKTKSIIYSNEAITLSSPASFITFLKNPIKAVIDWIMGSLNNKPTDYSFVQNTKKFNKLYINKIGSKSIHGVLEGGEAVGQKKYMAIDYSNIGTDVCTVVNQYDASYGNKDYVVCNQVGSSYYVVSRDSGYNFDPTLIWTDLIVKLRVE